MYPFLPEEAIGLLKSTHKRSIGCVTLTIVNPLPRKNADTLNRANERGSRGTFGTGPGIFRGPVILRMSRVKIGIQV